MQNDTGGGHSRSNSGDQADSTRDTMKRSSSNIIVRRDPSFAVTGLHPRSQSQMSMHTTTTARSSAQSQHLELNRPATPTPAPKSAAKVAITTNDGHMLEFDPLQTSPGSIDALEGITDSAKKQAKIDMSRLVSAAMEKWKVS